MKKLLSLLLSLLLVLSLAGCTETKQPTEQEEPDLEVIEPEESEETVEESQSVEAKWAENVPPVRFEPDWTVETSSETYLRELTDPKYQGRVTGSAGNRAAADWIESQFVQMGLQKLPKLGSYRQSYMDQVFEILPGYAAIVDADGSETELELGVDWVFKASYEDVDLTLPLSADLTDCEAGKAFLDGNLTQQNPHEPLKYIEVSTKDVAWGTGFFNKKDSASRIYVTPEVYEQLTQEGVKLHLRLPLTAQEGEVDNVVAYLPGEDSSHAVLICANFDGCGQLGDIVMPSAYNNASGVAAMLQTAQWLSKAEKLPCDVIFAAFNGEGNGWHGSQQFSYAIHKTYEQLLVLNIKCIAWSNSPLMIFAENDYANLRGDLAGGMGFQYKEQSVASDQISFTNKETMMPVTISQEAWQTDELARSALYGTYDVADNLDPSMIDELAKKLCAWVIERGGNTLTKSYPVIW